MPTPRPQFSLLTLLLLVAAVAIAVVWWSPGAGTESSFHWQNDAGEFPRSERLRSFEELRAYDEQTPSIAPSAGLRAPPDYVDFARQDILVLPRSIHERSLASIARLNGRLVVIPSSPPVDGRAGQVVMIPKSALVVFWPAPLLTIVDIAASCLPLAILLLSFYWRYRKVGVRS